MAARILVFVERCEGKLKRPSLEAVSAARRLARADWDPARNARVYGPKAELHGHDFTLEVTVRGVPPEPTGMVVDLKRLKQLIEASVVAKLDSRDLNRSALLGGKVATIENIVVAIWRQLRRDLDPGFDLDEVRLFEGPRVAHGERTRRVAARGDESRRAHGRTDQRSSVRIADRAAHRVLAARNEQLERIDLRGSAEPEGQDLLAGR